MFCSASVFLINHAQKKEIEMSLINRLLLLSAFVMCSSINAATITFLDSSSGDNRIDTIFGLEIEGDLYDAMFHYEISFNDLADPSITFNTNASAVAAIDAIAAFVNTVGDQTGIITDDVRVPFGLDGTLFRFVVGVATDSQNYSDWFNNVTQNASTLSSFVFGGSNSVDALVTFAPSTATVPEPGSLALSLSTIALGAIYFRRRRAASKR